MKLIVMIISAAAAAALLVVSVETATASNNSSTTTNSRALAARMLHVGRRQEGARQVQRLARNAQQKLELMSGRVSQIEERIAEDLSANSTEGDVGATMEPVAVSTGPIGGSLAQETTQSADEQLLGKWQAAPDETSSSSSEPAAKVVGGNRTQTGAKSWSSPVIKSVIPDSARRVPAPSETGEEASERREMSPSEELGADDHSASASEEPPTPATASPRTADSITELDLDAAVPTNTNTNAKPKASHRVAAVESSLLNSDWNPNQNHNYFLELNAKNHAAASQPAVSHYAGNKSTRLRPADKFPNMTITSSESDLANSYSSSHLAQQQQQQQKTAPESQAERRQSSSVKSFSPYRRQQQQQQHQVDYQLEQHNDSSSLRPIAWPAMASPLQQPQAPSSYYSMVQGTGKPAAGEEQVVYAGQPMAPLQTLGASSDNQAPGQASNGGQRIYSAASALAGRLSSSDLKHRSADGADSYAVVSAGADSSGAYAGSSQPDQQQQQQQPDSGHRPYAQERNMYTQEPQQQAQELTFGHYQPLPAGQRNDEQSTAQEEQTNGNQASEFELARAGSSQQRNNNHYYQTSNEQNQQQQPGASDIIALLRQIQQQRLQQRQQAASSPISRAYYAQTAPEQQPQYRRFSPDLLTAYLGGRQNSSPQQQQHQQQQAPSNQETATAASDLIPYTTSSHFQPVYSAGAYDSRNAAIYRAAMAAAAKANEQAGRHAAQVYLAAAAAAAAAQQQQQQQQQGASAQLSNNYSQLYAAAGSAPTYYESKSADGGASEVTSHLQRVHGATASATVNQQSQQQQQQHQQQQQQQQQVQTSSSYSPYRRNSYLNGLFKPSASSRYYYAPQLLSPVGLAAPVYAAPTSYAPAADALSQLYVAATSPYAVHAAQYAPADPSHQYQQALAAAVAANGLHAHYMTDPDMAESSLVATDGLSASYASPLASESAGAASDDSSGSGSGGGGSSAGGGSSGSGGSSGGGSSSAGAASLSKGGKTGVGQWTNIAGLLLGILPFGILMASLLPAVTVAGRKKRELELGVRNFAELLKWRAPSQVLDVLLGRADPANATFLLPGKLAALDRRRSLDAARPATTTTSTITTTTTTKRPQQTESAPTEAVAADERSLSMGNDLNQSTAYTMLAEAAAITTNSQQANGGQQQQQNQSTTANQSGVKAKVRKALSALNSFIVAAQNNMKRRHRSGESMESQWSLPSLVRSKLDTMFNLTDYKRQLASVVQQRLVAQHHQLLARARSSPAVTVGADNNSSSIEANNSSARNHLEVCLNQFLCRLTVKLNKSLRNSTHLGAGDANRNSSSANSHHSPLADTQLERITKKYINQLVEQIEAEHPSVSLSLFKRKTQDSPLDSLYKSAMQNQCSLVYNCVELLQLERTLSKMKLKFS